MFGPFRHPVEDIPGWEDMEPDALIARIEERITELRATKDEPDREVWVRALVDCANLEILVMLMRGDYEEEVDE